MTGALNGLPARGGIGLKPAHFASVLECAERGAGPRWVEVHPQNYTMDGGPMHHWLSAVRERLPLSFHSVGLSLGDPGGCDLDELERLACLADRYQPAMISDHIAWSSLDGESVPDLFPAPLTAEMLDHFDRQIDQVQNRLKRPILVENPSRMLAFAADEQEETDFLSELCRRSGCGLLLDINNVTVSAHNLGFDAASWLSRIDPAIVGEVHVAGHSLRRSETGVTLAVDDHGSPVREDCWSLLALFLERSGALPVLVERDNHLPDFGELCAEAERADRILAGTLADAA